MNSLNWKSPKNAAKAGQEFTPNIYRKPCVDSKDSDQTPHSDESSPEVYVSKPQPLIYKSEDPGSEQLCGKHDAQGNKNAEQESHLQQLKSSYDQELLEYKEKQAALDDLKKDLSEKQQELTDKCSILKSTILKADDKIPEVEVTKLSDKRAEFENEKISLERQVSQLRSAENEYSEQYKKLESDKEQLALELSQYEEEMSDLLQKKNDIEEKSRLFEEQFNSADDVVLDLDGVECSAMLNLIKSSYYSEIKEINRKRADLGSLKLETENEEISLQNRISTLDEVREQTKKDILELKPKIKELDELSADYWSRSEEHERNEKSLLEAVAKYELEHAALEEKRVDDIKKLSDLKNEFILEESLLKEKIASIAKSREENKAKEDSITLKSKQLETKEQELDFELAILNSKQQENQRMTGNIEHANAELEYKRKELASLRETLSEDINMHVTIRRQQLDIKKINKRMGQQSTYIRSLEDTVKELQISLEDARSDVRKNEVFTQILKSNLELSK